MKRLPKFLKEYFWDVDFNKLDFVERKIYILKRILEYGDEKAVAWMWKNFKKQEIRQSLTGFRSYSQKSANFWALILGVPKGKILCLRKHSPGLLKTIWPY